MNKPCLWAALGAWLLCSAACSPGLLDELDRVLRDPVVSAPRASSLEQEYRIELTWEADEAADEYQLERAEDAAQGSFLPVYRGSATRYLDADCRDQCRYLYRLSKLRGTRSFGPSAPVLGVASATCRDELEPNDSEGQATPLEYDRRANLFYYRATPGLYPGAELQDDDWYSVLVPPRRKANLLVTQPGLEPGSPYTFLYFYLKGTTPFRVVNNQLIEITNPSYEAKTFLFELFPNPDDFILEPTLGGGMLVDYTLSLYSIMNL
jgi:hypothetical protein